MAKTEILQIGNHTPQMIPLQYRQYIRTEQKMLGITFARKNISTINYTAKLNNIKSLTNWWKTRHLTMFGKAQIINAVLLAQVWYVGKAMSFPNKYIIQQIIREIYTFLWYPSKIQTINQKTLFLPEQLGGLNITNIWHKLHIFEVQRYIHPLRHTHSSAMACFHGL